MISENEYEAFVTACLNFHKTGFLYALKNFPLDNELLQHARIFNFLHQKCSFESIQFLVEKLQHCQIIMSNLPLMDLENLVDLHNEGHNA